MINLSLYSGFISAHLKSRLEYKYSFFMSLFIQVFTYSINYFVIWLVLNSFRTIQNWSYYEIVFLYNLNLFSYGLSSLFFWQPMRELETMVQQGTFDSMLIYPVNPFLHLIFRKFNSAFLGHLIMGGLVFWVCFGQLGIEWSVTKWVWLVFIILGAALIQSAVMILTGAMSFWFVKSTAAVDTTIYGVRRFIEYPITIYQQWIQVLLTFIVPYAFVNFFPALYFLNKNQIFHPAWTVVIGALLFLAAYFVWTIGIRNYQSTGS